VLLKILLPNYGVIEEKSTHGYLLLMSGNLLMIHIATHTDPQGITWEAAYSKADVSLARLTNSDKVGIVTGQGWQKGPCVGNTKAVPKIGLPSLCLQDGPVGIRYAMGVTVFPAGVHTASTWDVDLMHKRGLALGTEAKGLGIHVQLGPVAGPLGKIPGGGRNWEGKGFWCKLGINSADYDRVFSGSVLDWYSHAGNDFWTAKGWRSGQR
jgi:hypothetical protein